MTPASSDVSSPTISRSSWIRGRWRSTCARSIEDAFEAHPPQRTLSVNRMSCAPVLDEGQGTMDERRRTSEEGGTTSPPVHGRLDILRVSTFVLHSASVLFYQFRPRSGGER